MLYSLLLASSLLLGGGFMAPLVVPVLAQTPNLPTTDRLDIACKSTVFDVQQQIGQYKQAYVERVRLFYVDAEAEFPTEEPLSLLISLGAYDSVSSASGDTIVQSSALDIMASEQLLLNFSDRMMAACEPIVSVTYLLSDYQHRTFGLVDGAVQEFQCTDDPTQSPLPWGEQYCFTEF